VDQPELRRRPSRAEQVAFQLEDEILEARLPVGAHLGRRAEFMERFEISPTIMNETLRILRDRGLVSVRPGTGGGVFVSSLPPQVRLGALDLWFQDGRVHPLDLFEARIYLEDTLTSLAFHRADQRDIDAMQAALDNMQQAHEARAYLEALLRLHRALVSAARVTVLDGMHQTIVGLLQAGLSKAVFIDGYEPMLQHSLNVHRDLVEAIRRQDSQLFEKTLALHHEDLIRTDDPRRSPKSSDEL
jgi:DNA-binding FadR family transcriptional regulator